MPEEVNQEVERTPFMVKGMRVDTRKIAVACAMKAGETMAVWLDRAIRTQANMEAGERIFPPEENPPVPVRVARLLAAELGELADFMQAAQAIAGAAAVPIPKATARHAFALLTAHLRAARGLPPRKTTARNGKTITVEAAEILPSKV
jgi:hypothetical protein